MGAARSATTRAGISFRSGRKVSLLRYRVAILALLVAIAPSRATFPCDLASPSLPASSPWDANVQGADLHVGPTPRIFAFEPGDVPKLTTPGGQPLDVRFELADTAGLDAVDGLFVFAPNAPLEPGVYCVANQRCVTVEATFDASVPVFTVEVLASAYDGESGPSCSDDSCGPREGRSVGVVVRGYDHAADHRVANYLVSLSDQPDGTGNVFSTIVAADGYLNLDGALRNGRFELDDLDLVCARVRAVLWDGTVGPAVDAGCDVFD